MAKIHGQLERAQLENLTTAQEPAQGIRGRQWLNTDTGLVRVDDGTVIKDVGVASVPTAGLLDFAGSVAPLGWLLCDGAAVSRVTFLALFSAVGTTYGVGDGATTFNIPDFRGRVSAGKDDMGGVAANRITVAESGITGTALGNSGGSETHAVTTAESAVHDHDGSVSGTSAVPNNSAIGVKSRVDGALAIGPAGSDFVMVDATTGHNGSGSLTHNHTHSFSDSFTTTSVGSGNTHQNTQPTLIVNKIIKT